MSAGLTDLTDLTGTASSLPFTAADVEAADAAWGFNCGPYALCAALGLTPEQLRPHLADFVWKRHMTPTAMGECLLRLGVTHRRTYCAEDPSGRAVLATRAIRFNPAIWPTLGIVRLQFDGPWCAPGVPPAAAYKATHWIAVRTEGVDTGDEGDLLARRIADVNFVDAAAARTLPGQTDQTGQTGQSCLGSLDSLMEFHDGGWWDALYYEDILLPRLIRDSTPRANGNWWPTHTFALRLDQWEPPSPSAANRRIYG